MSDKDRPTVGVDWGKLRNAVLRVGSGRGFVVESADQRQRFVITAAHCLPDLPSYVGENSLYPRLLGRLEIDKTVAAECVFVDPVSDIAVLGEADDAELGEPFERLTATDSVFGVGRVTSETGVWILTLNDGWQRTTANRRGRAMWANWPSIEKGMSGSPVVDSSGRAVGVVTNGPWSREDEAGHQPLLRESLPGWLLRCLVKRQSSAKIGPQAE